LGCSYCRELRDRTFSSDMCYHPCFVRSKKKFRIEKTDQLKPILKKGDRIIDSYASRFQKSSPTLIQKERFVPGKREFFFRIDNPYNFRNFLKQAGFKHMASQRFHEEYYWPKHRSELWDIFERILKFGWSYHLQSKIDLVYTDCNYIDHQSEGMETVTQFLWSSGPMRFESVEEVRHFLDRLDFVKYLELDWELETWKHKNNYLNLSFTENRSTIKIDGPVDLASLFRKEIEKYDGKLEPLREPLVQFMRD